MTGTVSPRLRAAVIGLGVGEEHVHGYAAYPDCDVVAACDTSAAKLASFQDRWPDLPTTSDPAEILEHPEIDVVSIASYDDAHCDQICAALENGKHVFVEKPLCQTVEQLRRVKETWRRQGGRCCLRSNLVLRAAPLFEWLREQVAAGMFGRPYSFDGDYLFGRLHKLTQGWRGELDHYSVMAGGGVHLIDLLVWLIGERPQWVTAHGNRMCSAGSRFQHDDYVAATLRFPSGMLARITANFGCVHGHQHVVRLFGTRGTFLHDDRGPRMQFARDPAPPATAVDLATLPASKHALIPGFLQSIINAPEDDPAADDTAIDFDVMSIVLACDEALRTGSLTEIEYA